MALTGEDGDQTLIVAAQRGERAALDALVHRHDRWVRHVVYATVANAAVADDVMQEVWTKVWQQIHGLVEPASWRSWLYRLARHAAIDAGRAGANERRREVADLQDRPTAAADDPQVALCISEEHRRVLAAVKALPDIYREPFILRHLEGWSYARIGEAMSLPVDTVETRLVRARRLLRQALNRDRSED